MKNMVTKEREAINTIDNENSFYSSHSPRNLLMGVDVGSTTVKIAVLDQNNIHKVLHSQYIRHNARQGETVLSLIEEAHSLFPNDNLTVTFCGSSGQTYADATGGFFIQEVVANTLALKQYHPDVRVAIELGGQDAKVVFFDYDSKRKQLTASDMRMNGSCAGGTGAFIDQIAELLDIRTEEFNKYAKKGETLYEISGRCGVFAKTDIHPLLNQGVNKEDIALSSFHALAKQTIGGLAQGMPITPKVVFEGGPLTFNPRLIEVFKERLGLTDNDIVIPERPELLVACGAALAPLSMYADEKHTYSLEKAQNGLKALMYKSGAISSENIIPWFTSKEEENQFRKRHSLPENPQPDFQPASTIQAYLGIDAGSTTCKFVLIDKNGNLIYTFYAHNRGEPLAIIRDGLVRLREDFKAKDLKLKILGIGTTGYGENLFARAFKADYHCVETVAHARAAQQYAPGVSFILDIGGQDMKAISLQNGIVSEIVLNEACSAGCGSFVETYAKSLGIPPKEIADLAFSAEQPGSLGSRCTVFMNSAIITEQKNGKSSADIIAGICRSIIENVFTKVVRVNNFQSLGDKVVVQGGTFKNDAVLRAFEQYTGREPIRAPYPGEMGAIGIALLTKEHIEQMKETVRAVGSKWESSFIGLDALDSFSYSKEPGQICPFCANHCSRTVVRFSDGTKYITGNRCERGEVLGEPKDESVQKEVKEKSKEMKQVSDMYQYQEKLLFKNYEQTPVLPPQGQRIGLPKALEMYSSMPFWSTLFRVLGFEVVLSGNSSYKLFDKALPFVPSDTICFPAKLLHGHIESLLEKGVDRIFLPQMIRMPAENDSADYNLFCAILQGYSMVADKSNEPLERFNVPLDHPIFHWSNNELKNKQLTRFFYETFGIRESKTKEAIFQASSTMEQFYTELKHEGEKILKTVEKKNEFAVLLAGRPYHLDPLVNHEISRHFTRLGIPVLTLDSLPKAHNVNLKGVRTETNITYHNRMMESTLNVARHPNLELVQIVSFGCGHDAIISDEMTRILRESSGKELLVLKLDEGEASGPMNIRIKSFVQTVNARRKKEQMPFDITKIAGELHEAFKVKFLHSHRKEKMIYVPNLSPAFSRCLSNILADSGYNVTPLPIADKKAIELGKKYVHNDICFPAQINIGEFLSELERGKIDQATAAFGVAKNCEACRAGQYPALARKALDEAGYKNIPIITTGTDTKNMHPGFSFSVLHQLYALRGVTILDALERMRRRIRPYEVHTGECDKIFDTYADKISKAVSKSLKKSLDILSEAIEAYNSVKTENVSRKPRVGVIGEILLNYHPAANGYIERYLEKHGMEVILPNLHDFFRKNHYIDREIGKRGLSPKPLLDFIKYEITGRVFDFVLKRVQKRMKAFKYMDECTNVHNLAEKIKDIIDLTYRSGEGWKIPAEIIQMQEEGIHSFVIVQPFGCLPNHVTGRGFIKPLKKMYPHIQILSLDYDPDISYANIENRLQMLIINAKEKARTESIVKTG